MTESEVWSRWLKDKPMSAVNAKIKEGLASGQLSHKHIPIIYKAWKQANQTPEAKKSKENIENRKKVLDKLF